MSKQWVVTIAERDYKIELEHNIWTNTQKVCINGQMIFESPTKLYIGGIICFNIEGQTCAVIITNKMLGFSYDLIVNGISIITQKRVKYAATQPVAVMVNGVAQKINQDKEK